MEVLTLNATQANGKISISGTTEQDMLAVAISVYDQSGTNRVALRSTSVNNGTFSYELEIAEANYQICVADYNGGECKTVTVTVAAEESSEESAAGTPETGYQTITKNNETVAPATNASASNMVYVFLAAGLIAAAAIALVARRIYLTRKAKK